MKKILVPSRSQRNLSLGLFQAESLGSVQSAEKVDMVVAKVAVRHNRWIKTGEFRQIQTAKAKARRLKSWWKYRRYWKSVRIGSRSGKLHPNVWDRVEFPDGSIGWLK
jgi:hypothetical protein